MVCFTLTELTASARHPDFIGSFQLELMPELLKQPEIAWTERWVRSPDCAAVSGRCTAELATVQYAELTVYHPPADASMRVHRETCERIGQLGFGPDPASIREAVREYFVPLKGYVLPRVLIAEEVLPFRPARGIYAILSRFHGHGASAEAAFRWYDEIRIPDLLSCGGAAGAWSMASAALFRPDRDLSVPALRLVLLWLDEDPVAFASASKARAVEWRENGRMPNTSDVEEVLFEGPLRTIVPWEWGWFDAVRPS